jgi:hypothetical protein
VKSCVGPQSSLLLRTTNRLAWEPATASSDSWHYFCVPKPLRKKNRIQPHLSSRIFKDILSVINRKTILQSKRAQNQNWPFRSTRQSEPNWPWKIGDLFLRFSCLEFGSFKIVHVSVNITKSFNDRFVTNLETKILSVEHRTAPL